MSVPSDVLTRFPRLTEERLKHLLALPSTAGKLRLILDTDTANEIDDQFTLAWVLLSQDRLELEGVTAEPFSFQHLGREMMQASQITSSGGPTTDADRRLVETYQSWLEGYRALGQRPEDIVFVPPSEGQELSLKEIHTVYEKLGLSPTDKVFRGSEDYLQSFDAPLRTPAAEHIVERALAASDRPLYVAAIGCVTNLASAMLIEPKIIENIVVLWTSSYPSHAPHNNRPSLNLVQDVLASQLLFASGAAHVYLPGYHVGAQLRISLPEMEAFVRGRGKIGDYLHHLFTHNPIHAQRGVLDTKRRTWVIWDMINIAWLLNPSWVPTRMTKSPRLGDDLFWERPEASHDMREAYDVDRDAIFIDFYDKLEKLRR